METIFKNPQLKSQNGRNAFDRSQHRVWHSPFGALLPCFCKRVTPGDYVELSVESQTICDRMVRPAFIRLKEHFNFYFVPFNMLWMPFDNFVTGQDNYFSVAAETIQQGNVPNKVPTFSNKFLANMFAYLDTQKDVHGFGKLNSTLRLLDLLGYGNFMAHVNACRSGQRYDYTNGLSYLSGMNEMNLFALMAYQKVYYDYFRNPKYEMNETNAFNIDDIANATLLDNTEQPGRFEKMFTMNYAWAKKDYFTDVEPSVLPSSSNIGYRGLASDAPMENIWSIFGVPGTNTDTGNVAKLYDSGQAGYNNNEGLTVVVTPDSLPIEGQTASSRRTLPSVASIRFAFAYEKLQRRMREAGGTFDKQMLAQFGIVPYDQRHGKCIFIGGQTNRLNASDVISTNNNQSSSEPSLGFLGGQLNCYSPARTTFKYHAKDHGIIIGIYNTSLDYDYPSYGVERDNLAKLRFDWFNPAFENLGLQPTFRLELLNIKRGLDGGSYEWDSTEIEPTAEARDVLGFSIRYQEYKTSIDKVFGNYCFQSGDVERQAWVSQFLPLEIASGGSSTFPAKPICPLDRQTLTFNPLMFNQVLSTNYNGNWNTDPFNHNTYIHCKAISNMSSLGEVF